MHTNTLNPLDVRCGKVKTYGHLKFGFILPDGVYNESQKLHFRLNQGREIAPGYLHPLFTKYPIREPRMDDRLVFVQVDPEDPSSPIIFWGYEENYHNAQIEIHAMRFQIFRQFRFKKELESREPSPVGKAMNARDLLRALESGTLRFCPTKVGQNCITTEYVGKLGEFGGHKKVALVPEGLWVKDESVSAVA